MKYDIATPYTAVYIVFRRDNKIAFLLRSNTNWMNDHYGLPAGKVEKKEKFIAAAIREAQEETGIKLKPEDLKLILTGQRHHLDSDWVDVVFEAKQWEGKLHNAEPHVHGELAWFNPDKLPRNMVDYVRFYIEQIQTGKNYAEYTER